jgi:nitrogen regulatory protein PII-like uncharacterized protein
LYLKRRLNTTDWSKDATPYRFYTFIVKETAEKAIEQIHDQQKAEPQLTSLGERNEVDVLDMFLETLA